MSTTEPMLDFAPEARAGFRLQRIEVFNWGTFDERVWSLTPNGDNSLLTGDIGSGKSTLVDAITTLLVPAQRITYNKAAGADSRERSLRSYVLGYYKSERGDAGLAPKPVALRDRNGYSVILGHFHNEGYDQHVTLAQVFWISERRGQPERFHVVADRPLRIVDDFADFGPDLKALRKRLRADALVEIHDTFPPYGAAFRRRFGIESEQALELFNQTVSMKSVGNLTDFVREHMLEAFPVEDRIEVLIRHFDDLDQAHRAVLKAKAQVAALEPLVADADRHRELSSEREQLRRCREALRPWFAGLKAELLTRRLQKLAEELETLRDLIERVGAERRAQSRRRDSLVKAVGESGGDRLDEIRSETEGLESEQGARRRRWDDYRELAETLRLPPAVDDASFRANQREVDEALSAAREARADIQSRLTAETVALQDLQGKRAALDAELESLRRRRSNIPAEMFALREQLCEATGLAAETLPFAGELIQVREDEGDWEGAVERLLRGFGLSLLVPDEQYGTVAEWVDRTRLRGRLVYFRVRRGRKAAPSEPDPESVPSKLVIRPDSPLYDWLEVELWRRFDHACCTTLDRFQRENKALTRAGQIKGRGERHEKDDRQRIDDRTRYVLGWSNEAKIAALEAEAGHVERQVQGAAERVEAIRQEDEQHRERENTLNRIAVYRDFHEMDWHATTRAIERLESERRALEAASDQLTELQDQLEKLETQLVATERELTEAQGKHAVAESRQEEAREALDEARALHAVVPDEIASDVFPRLQAMREEALGEHTLTVESCGNRQADMREWLQNRIDVADKQLARLRDRIVQAMQSYRNEWPLETQEVDTSIEAAEAYRSILETLLSDDLPRFEARFKRLLNENTIREVANFQAQLNKERAEIEERIETINRSLREVDYNPGRYIALLAEVAQDAEVRHFRQDLRACTEGALTGSEDEQYSESKFLQVKSVIERLRGREGSAELDRRWSRKVTDVRNWFEFSVSERWREDDREHEHYTDSGGKSGGQKEKLAYTVLAASLAYQFGLEWGARKSRSFRFVVIDEAFGRGSDDSARFGLELFRRLNLQLLIVTPLQKIHIIEPYVANVGFVHSEGGRQSMLRNLDIEEFRAERRARELIRLDPAAPATSTTGRG